jgi:outer membrane protein assembly factor BamE (lipoprotein component of BamABCDE complex)
MRSLTLLSLFLGMLSLSGCVSNTLESGYTFDNQSLLFLEPGKTTQYKVEKLLGSPSTTSEYGDTTWYYIASTYHKKAFFKPKLFKQRVLAITFDKKKVITTIQHYDDLNAKDVALVEHITPTQGHDMSAIGQLLGNVGRFNKSRER